MCSLWLNDSYNWLVKLEPPNIIWSVRFCMSSSWSDRSAVRPVCQTATAYSKTARMMAYHPEELLLFSVASGDVVLNLFWVLHKQCVSSTWGHCMTRQCLQFKSLNKFNFRDERDRYTVWRGGNYFLNFPFINLHIHVPNHLTSLTRREDLCRRQCIRCLEFFGVWSTGECGRFGRIII